MDAGLDFEFDLDELLIKLIWSANHRHIPLTVPKIEPVSVLNCGAAILKHLDTARTQISQRRIDIFGREHEQWIGPELCILGPCAIGCKLLV